MRARQGDPALAPAARARVLFLPQSNPCRADPYTAVGALLSARGLKTRALTQQVRLGPDPLREPPGERTEYQPGLDRKGNVGGHADEHSER